MKKIINGKLYNTETATPIASNSSRGLSISDFRYFHETLYQTKKGQFFLSGEGHAMSRWATSNGNSSCWGEGIISLTNRDALHWCEQANISTETIQEYFTIDEA